MSLIRVSNVNAVYITVYSDYVLLYDNDIIQVMPYNKLFQAICKDRNPQKIFTKIKLPI